MKRLKFNNQTTLKALLLFALVANVSFEPIKRGFEHINLSQVSSEARNSNGADTTNTVGETAAPPAATTKVSEPKYTSVREKYTVDVRNCGGKTRYYTLSYQQIEQDGQLWTAGFTTSASDTEQIKHTVSGKYEIATRQAIADEVKKIATERCEAENERIAESKRVAEDLKKEEAANAIKVKNCEMKKVGSGTNARYESYDDDDEQIKCLIDRLQSVDGSDRKNRGQGFANVQRLAGDRLKSLIKRKLTSLDEDEIEEGKEQAQEAIEAIRDLKEEFGSTHSAAIDRMARVFEGMVVSSDTLKKSREFKERAREVKEELVTSWRAMKTDPMDPFAIDQFRHAEMMRDQYRFEFDRDLRLGLARQSMRYQSVLGSSDYGLFHTPYLRLLDEMPTLFNAATLSDGLPSTFGTYDGLYTVSPDLLSARRASPFGTPGGYWGSNRSSLMRPTSNLGLPSSRFDAVRRAGSPLGGGRLDYNHFGTDRFGTNTFGSDRFGYDRFGARSNSLYFDP